jgi:ribosomal protein S18 acetylase RimI-like enzyme
MTTPVTAGVIADVCAFYRAAGAPQAGIQLPTFAVPENWGKIRAPEGIATGTSSYKLIAEVGEVVARTRDSDRRRAEGLQVLPVDSGDALAWGAVMMRAFGMPEEHYAQMAAATVGSPGWRPYGVWMDQELVGAGNMYVEGDRAQMFGGAVLPHARNRGGQTELLATRAEMAGKLGCRFLIAETGVEADGAHNTSLHNMLRLGFRIAYERQSWIWRSDSSEK